MPKEASRSAVTPPPVDPEESTASSATPRVSIGDLPRLPDRGPGYRSEPRLGCCIVSVIAVACLAGMHAKCLVQVADSGLEGVPQRMRSLLALVWAEAAAAVLSTLYILFGGAGVIRRGPGTCYPMPSEVEELLCSGQTTEGLDNIKGNGRPGMPDGTYCVRCLVWRLQEQKAHHCNICQRCVAGFDHHCGVFGRCIVAGNMACFMCLILMLFASGITVLIAVASDGDSGITLESDNSSFAPPRRR